VNFQEIAAFAVAALAVAYLVVRHFRRRATGNCCGEKECPAAKGMVEKIRGR
jgi:hypothetical protein